MDIFFFFVLKDGLEKIQIDVIHGPRKDWTLLLSAVTARLTVSKQF